MPNHPISAEDVAFWADVRKKFYLRDGVTFLNGGSVGPSAKPTIEKTIRLMRKMESDPLEFQWQFVGKEMNIARKKLGAFVGADPDRIALVQNTTMGMNIPSQGLKFKRGQEIVMSNQEYPSVSGCWNYTARRDRLKVRAFALPTPPATSQDIVDAYTEQMTDKTAVVVFSHVYYTTGLVTDVTALSRLAHQYGALAVVDGAHAVGMTPMTIDDMDCDFYASSCHKWLLAPKGVGMLYVAKKQQNKVLPLFKGYMSNSESAHRYDMTGTRDLTHHAGLGYAIDFQRKIGWEDKIRPYCLGLARYFRQRLEEIDGVRLMVPPGPDMSGFITTFTIDGINIGMLAGILRNDYSIETTNTSPNDIHCFRISTHFYNNHGDVDTLVDTIKEVIATNEDVHISGDA